MYRQLNILPCLLYVMYSSNLSCYKVMHGHVLLRGPFSLVKQSTPYNERYGSNLAIQRSFSTKYGLNFVKTKMLSEFNALNKNIKKG